MTLSFFPFEHLFVFFFDITLLIVITVKSLMHCVVDDVQSDYRLDTMQAKVA